MLLPEPKALVSVDLVRSSQFVVGAVNSGISDHVYGIGDNPKSDIRGANSAGPHWSSILVKSGCLQVRNSTAEV